MTNAIGSVNDMNYSDKPAIINLSDTDSTFYLPINLKHSGAETLAITMTREDQSRDEALALINRRYAWRGYGSGHKLSRTHDEMTFTAQFGGSLVGTVTLAADSAAGLAVDATFSDEMQFFRRKPHARLCELKKLAMECNIDSKPVLASLFHLVFIFGTNNYLGTDLLIEVNPRHASFYQRMLGFRRVGELKINTSVNAPSQLMWLPVKDIETAIEKCHGNPNSSSLYKYFYAREFEDRIVDELNARGLRENIAHDGRYN